MTGGEGEMKLKAAGPKKNRQRRVGKSEESLRFRGCTRVEWVALSVIYCCLAWFRQPGTRIHLVRSLFHPLYTTRAQPRTARTHLLSAAAELRLNLAAQSVNKSLSIYITTSPSRARARALSNGKVSGERERECGG